MLDHDCGVRGCAEVCGGDPALSVSGVISFVFTAFFSRAFVVFGGVPESGEGA